MWLQLLVSRVLSRASVAFGTLAVIPLGRPLPNASCSLPRGSGWQPSNAPLHGLAPDGVCRAATVTGCAVGSYSTFSPLPKAPERFGWSDFLWHFPRGFPHRALPGILPCGARTFLSTVVRRNCDRLRGCNARSLALLTGLSHEQIALPWVSARWPKWRAQAASWMSSQPLPRESSVIRVFSFFLARASSWRARSRDTPNRRPISASDISSSLSAIKRCSTM